LPIGSDTDDFDGPFPHGEALARRREVFQDLLGVRSWDCVMDYRLGYELDRSFDLCVSQRHKRSSIVKRLLSSPAVPYLTFWVTIDGVPLRSAFELRGAAGKTLQPRSKWRFDQIKSDTPQMEPSYKRQESVREAFRDNYKKEIYIVIILHREN
jgi:hypothetical protein